MNYLSKQVHTGCSQLQRGFFFLTYHVLGLRPHVGKSFRSRHLYSDNALNLRLRILLDLIELI